MKDRLLILYSEFMPYNLIAIQKLQEIINQEIHVVNWDNNKISNYSIKQENYGIIFHNRSSFSKEKLLEFAQNLNPRAVFVSGWMDKGYLYVCKKLKRKGAIIICGLDNPWQSTLRQKISVFFHFYFFRPYFSKFFVAGIPQYIFANKMGYTYAEIDTGLYTADTKLFSEYYNHNTKTQNTKSILFVGRFSEVKNIKLLINSFIEVLDSNEFKNTKLILIGNGPLKSKITEHPNIQIYDFLSQIEIARIAKDVSFFCLPSIHEPWGVVVHEMAAMGLPLLLSKQCMSASQFLIEDFNGFTFDPNSKTDLKGKLLKMLHLDNELLLTMGENSHLLSKQNSPEIWAKKFINLAEL